MEKVIWSISPRDQVIIEFAGSRHRLEEVLMGMLIGSEQLAASLTGVVVGFWTGAGIDCGDLKNMVVQKPEK